MITAREQVLDIMEDYLITQTELISQLWAEDSRKWDEKTQALYYNGVVLGKFREKHSATMNVLKSGIEDSLLKSELEKSCKLRIKELERIINPNFMEIKELNMKRKALEELSVVSLDEWIDRQCGWATAEKKEITNTEFKALLYLYYVFEDINRVRKHPCCTDNDRLEVVYKNIFEKKSQYSKYGLLPIDESRKVILIDPPRIYDKIVDKTLFIKNVPKELLAHIYDMFEEGMIGELALRVSNYDIYDGRALYQYLCEAVERGKIFDFISLGTYGVTRLYSDKYDNCLWVKIESDSITFEELCDDFLVYEDCIITQVIHMEYVNEGNQTYITHLDHEYIFYSIEDYEQRCKNVDQKGEAHKRWKSFKIDSAKIPFLKRIDVEKKDEYGNVIGSNDEQFLCYVLECYFFHKDLLKEYFQNIS